MNQHCGSSLLTVSRRPVAGQGIESRYTPASLLGYSAVVNDGWTRTSISSFN